jgi:hypothetical protein
MGSSAPTVLNHPKVLRPDVSPSVRMQRGGDGSHSASPSEGLRALARHLGRLAAAEAMRASKSPALPSTLETTNEHPD